MKQSETEEGYFDTQNHQVPQMKQSAVHDKSYR
jgi:hypothetical protein